MQPTRILSIVIAVSLLAATGYVVMTKDDNNVSTTNSNGAVGNTNSTRTTNVNQGSNVNANTSDWLTYTNEEYGFSFQYPGDWGSVQTATGNIAPFLLVINFRDENNKQQDIAGNPRLVISNNDAQNVSASDANSWFDYSKVDFTKTDAQLAQDLRRNLTETMTVEKIPVAPKPAVKVTEVTSNLDGKKTHTLHILIPNYHVLQNNLTISGDISIADELLQIANTLVF